MILVRLDGGLGNQMFQYGLGRYLSIVLNKKLLLDISLLNDYRSFELKHLKIQAKIASPLEISLFDSRNASLAHKLFSKIYNTFKDIKILSENTFRQLDNIASLKSANIFCIGHWQDEMYFKAIQNQLKEEFSIKNKIPYLVKDNILASNSVSIHIRRGDYTNSHNLSIHGVLPIEYYLNAVDLIKRKIKNPLFFLFSDDLSWVKEHLKLQNSIIVDENSHREPVHDMHLMSLCKHNIIANSSYSWWAAWLNSANNKMVIAPQRWYADSAMNNNQMTKIPSDWIRI